MIIIKIIREIIPRFLSELFFISVKIGLFFKKPTQKEDKLIFELRNNLIQLPKTIAKNSKAENEWVKNENKLRKLINGSDPRSFLIWRIIRKTMFLGNSSYVKKELNYLKNNNWNLWNRVIKETKVGYPAPYLFYPESSGNSIHNAYHLSRFEEQTKNRVIDADYIFEFGGGYGNMCRLIKNMGFKGRYIMFDLPIFSALQVFYLKMLGLNVELGINDIKDGISCLYKIDQAEYMFKNILSSKGLFIATWSISESPIEIRNNIFKFSNSFNSFLIAYQNKFGEMNNLTFFKDWTVSMNDFEWHDKEIAHLPNNYYLFGKKLG